VQAGRSTPLRSRVLANENERESVKGRERKAEESEAFFRVSRRRGKRKKKRIKIKQRNEKKARRKEIKGREMPAETRTADYRRDGMKGWVL